MTSQPTHVAPPLPGVDRIELHPRFENVKALDPKVLRRQLLLKVVGCWVFGIIFLAASLVLLIGMVFPFGFNVRGSAIFGVVFGLLWAGFFGWCVVQRTNDLRRLRSMDQDRPVAQTLPFAFDVSDDAVAFPGGVVQDAEVWPLEAVRVRVVQQPFPGLVLSCEGKRTRRLYSWVLRGTPEAAAEVIKRRQREVGG